MAILRGIFVLSSFTCLFALGACGSDDDESSAGGGTLVGFTGSKCKKESGGSALTAAEAHAGLECVRWKPSGEGLQIDLSNFEGACGASWQGVAKQSEKGLELRATNPSCLLAACGSCMYDWSFQVKVDTTSDLALDLVTDPCPGQQTPETESLTLPLSKSAEGELCHYASYGGLSWQAGALGQCGQAFMPCQKAGGMCDGTGAPCQAGLECAPGASATEEVCHPTCTTDTDCALSGILSCKAGLCEAPTSF